MDIWKMYAVTFVEITDFLSLRFFLAENLLRNVYESAGIAYVGNVGVVWFGLSFFLFCLYSLFRFFILSKKNAFLTYLGCLHGCFSFCKRRNVTIN